MSYQSNPLFNKMRWLIAPLVVISSLLTTAIPLPAFTSATLIVTNPADIGPGTLRQALLDARAGDAITFDAVTFPPAAPGVITRASPLPDLAQGDLSLDDSHARVLRD